MGMRKPERKTESRGLGAEGRGHGAERRGQGAKGIKLKAESSTLQGTLKISALGAYRVK